MTNRALRTKTTITGQHYYDEGDLVDDHRPATAKDAWGGWNGPPPVVRDDPEKGPGYHPSRQSRCSSTMRRCETFAIH
eukprot:7371061-Pyramimonas_sp.AAC.1